MAKLVQTPSEALALGMLADIMRHHPDAARTPPTDEGQQDDAIVEAAAAHEVWRRRSRDAQLRRSGNGRIVAQHNQGRGEVLLQKGRLQGRMDVLRSQQAQAASAQGARVLRRQRAELAVEMQELELVLAGHDAALQQARTAQAQAQAELAEATLAGREAANKLQALQRQAVPLAASFAAVKAELGKAACRLWLAGHDDAALQAWRLVVVHAARTLLQLHGAIAAGRYSKNATDLVLAGRDVATGEVLAALVACGEMRLSAELFGQACPPEQFFHHIFFVFRAYCFGLSAAGEAQQLMGPLRLHRYADGLRGAFARTYWALLQQEGAQFAAALKQLVVHDWRTWSQLPEPAIGLVSTTACALARLGAQAGLEVPHDLGPLVPARLWQSPPHGV